MKIDWWTLLLQTINVLILLWLLRHFLLRPLQTTIAARQQDTVRAGAELKQATQQAEQARTALDAERQAMAGAREQALSAARAEAQAAAQQVLDQAGAEAARLRAAGQAQLEHEQQAAVQALTKATLQLSTGMVRRLLARMPQGCPDLAFLPGALAAASSGAGPDTHQGTPATLELVSAHPLDAAAQSAAQADVVSALGPLTQLTFRSDPALLAGVELHFQHRVVRNHWAADLLAISEAMRDDPATST